MNKRDKRQNNRYKINGYKNSRYKNSNRYKSKRYKSNGYKSTGMSYNKKQDDEKLELIKFENGNYKNYKKRFDGIKISIIVTILLLVFIAACGVVLILYSNFNYGPAITHDSVAYMHAAESLLSGKGMQYFGYESPFTQWPPLFPLLLAGLKSVGANLVYVSSYINAITYALIIMISGLWVLSSTGKRSFAIMTSLALLVSIPLYYVFKSMWSEPLFILFVLLFLISMGSHINKTNPKMPFQKISISRHSRQYKGRLSKKYLVMASIFAALACLTRYVGITLIITGVFVLLLLQKKKIINRLLETILFGVISSIPILMWIIRNYVLTGTLMGDRVPSQKSLVENINLFFDTITLWIAPVYSRNLSYLILGILTFLAIIIIIACNFNILSKCSAEDNTNSINNKSVVNSVDAKDNVNKITILFAFIVIYSAYMIFSATVISIDSINNRLLSPIYPALVLLIILTIEKCMDIKLEENKKFCRALYIVLTIILYSSWIIYPYTVIRKEAYYSYENGAGILVSVWWRNSPTIKYIEELPLDTVICSNSSDAIYFHSGRTSRYPPKKSGIYWYGIDEFKEFIEKNENVYIIWFRKKNEDTMYSITELQEYFTMEMIDELYDSTVYKVVGSKEN
ncbi:MAG: hypothetical protein GYA02_06760 [Clostridiaceae bacterium]|nr:hypothetical protein [Clostridiaceae bacterium]